MEQQRKLCILREHVIGLVGQRQVLGFLAGRTLAQSPDRGAGWLQQPRAAKQKLGKKPKSMEHDVHE